MILCGVAKDTNLPLTVETFTSAEKILINELKENGMKKTALNFLPLILTILEEAKLSQDKHTQ